MIQFIGKLFEDPWCLSPAWQDGDGEDGTQKRLRGSLCPRHRL